jgi:hypothetical protein
MNSFVGKSDIVETEKINQFFDVNRTLRSGLGQLFFYSLVHCVPSAVFKARTCIHYYKNGFGEIYGLFPLYFSELHFCSFGTDIC